VVSNGRVELRKVQVGYVALNVVEILSGLKAGEQVLVEKLDQFRDGDRVRVEVSK
jgi:multidrug efflux pump subunit AcrA (membrane-fusion protein)